MLKFYIEDLRPAPNQIVLEETRNSKTKLTITKDSLGSYSFKGGSYFVTNSGKVHISFSKEEMEYIAKNYTKLVSED